MTAMITIASSGRRFPAEAEETLLEAALRAGVAVDYNCANGSCGDCKARLLSGELGKPLPQDYRMTAQEKAEGMILLCRNRATGDLVIDTRVAHSAADIPRQQIEAVVSKIEQPRPDVAVVSLRTPRSKSLRFLAGQHVSLAFDGQPVRCKSVASCPCLGNLLQFHFRYVAGDSLAEHVFHRLRPRDKVAVEGPYGEFALDESEPRPLLFVAYETGFAAIKSLIEHAISLDWGVPMRLYWLGRHDGDYYLENYCRSWRDALDDFEYRLVRLPVEAEPAAAVRVLGESLPAMPELARYGIYMTGPQALCRELAAQLGEKGVPQNQVFFDRLEKS